MKSRRWLRLAAVPVALALVAGACGGDDDDDAGGEATTAVDVEETTAPADTEGGEATTPEDTEGGDATTPEDGTEAGGAATPAAGTQDFDGAEVTITGSERDDPSVVAINESLAAFGDANNISITFTGDADWEANINTQVEGGNPPNIGIFPQPGKLADFARAESIVPLSEEVQAAVEEYWDPKFSDFAVVDDVLYGVPVKTDVKSLVWYKPATFEAAGWEVPETFEDFTALMETMKTEGDGRKPLCVGIESGNATGWPFTDWTEEMVLRSTAVPRCTTSGPPTRSRSTTRRSSRRCSASSTCGPRRTCSPAAATIAATNFGDNAQALVDDQCYIHRQATFFRGASSRPGRLSPTGPRTRSTSSTSRPTARTSRC
jgi:alpha-glucoside transport system substrate-binding protein